MERRGKVRHVLRTAKEQTRSVRKLGSRIAARFNEAGLTANLLELRGATRDVKDLKGIVPKPAKPVSVEDMKCVTAAAVLRKLSRRLKAARSRTASRSKPRVR